MTTPDLNQQKTYPSMPIPPLKQPKKRMSTPARLAVSACIMLVLGLACLIVPLVIKGGGYGLAVEAGYKSPIQSTQVFIGENINTIEVKDLNINVVASDDDKIKFVYYDQQFGTNIASVKGDTLNIGFDPELFDIKQLSDFFSFFMMSTRTESKQLTAELQVPQNWQGSLTIFGDHININDLTVDGDITIGHANNAKLINVTSTKSILFERSVIENAQIQAKSINLHYSYFLLGRDLNNLLDQSRHGQENGKPVLTETDVPKLTADHVLIKTNRPITGIIIDSPEVWLNSREGYIDCIFIKPLDAYESDISARFNAKQLADTDNLDLAIYPNYYIKIADGQTFSINQGYSLPKSDSVSDPAPEIDNLITYTDDTHWMKYHISSYDLDALHQLVLPQPNAYQQIKGNATATFDDGTTGNLNVEAPTGHVLIRDLKGNQLLPNDAITLWQKNTDAGAVWE